MQKMKVSYETIRNNSRLIDYQDLKDTVISVRSDTKKVQGLKGVVKEERNGLLLSYC